MRKIFVSLVTIFAMGALIAGVTKAYFTDRATLGVNTFSTGILEIRFNDQEVLPGFVAENMAPGDVYTKEFALQNYGQPYFAGPSTLSAKGLLARSEYTSGNQDLYNALKAKLYVNAGWGGCSNGDVVFEAGRGCIAYDGKLKNMTGADILYATQWGAHAELIPGNSFTMTFDVYLPDSGDQTALMGETTGFNLHVDGYTNWPI